jgi:hypothetical protein
MYNKKINHILIFTLLLIIAFTTAITCGGSESTNNNPNNNNHNNNNPIPNENQKEAIYKTPESFLYDEESGYYFVSNINGSPGSKDDNGYIVKLGDGFELVDNYFIDGKSDDYTLNAPKGLTVIDGTLYVTDIDHVRGFSVEEGKHIRDIGIDNASFLNDITHDEESNLYVSGTNSGRIYKIDTDFNVTELSSIEGPNGVYYETEQDILYVVTWKGGKVFRIIGNGQPEEIDIDYDFQGLDGLDYYRDELYFSDFPGGKIYKYSLYSGSLSTLYDDLTSPADMSLDKVNRKILIPLLKADKVVVRDIK